MRLTITLLFLGVVLLLIGAIILVSSTLRAPKEISSAGFVSLDNDGDGIVEKVKVPLGETTVTVDVESGSIETKDGSFIDDDGDGIIDTYVGEDGQKEKASEPFGANIPRVVVEVNTDINTEGLPVVVGEEDNEIKAIIFLPGNTPGVAIDIDNDGRYDLLQKGKKIYFDEDNDGGADSMLIIDSNFIVVADLELRTFEVDANRDGTVEVEGNDIYVCIDLDHDGVCEVEVDASGDEPKYSFDPASVVELGEPEILEMLNDQERLRSYFFERFRSYFDAFQGLLEERERNQVTLPRLETQTIDILPSPDLPEVNVEDAEINACLETARWYMEYLQESPYYREDIEEKIYPYENPWNTIKAKLYLEGPARDQRLLSIDEVNYVYVSTNKKPLQEFAREPTRVYVYYIIDGTWEVKEMGEGGYHWVEKDVERPVAIYCDGFGRITYGIFLWWDRE